MFLKLCENILFLWSTIFTLPSRFIMNYRNFMLKIFHYRRDASRWKQEGETSSNN
jgi:hypothetical protein